MLRKIGALILSIPLTALSAHAHDAWIEVHQTAAETAETSHEAAFFIGHADDLSHYALTAARVSSLTLHNPGGNHHFLQELADFSRGDSISFSTSAAPQILSLTTFRAQIELESETFNEYAAEEGITPILQTRVEDGALDTPGTETYSRFLKALVMPDSVTTCDTEFIRQPIGHILEIIPLTNPEPGCSDVLDFQLLYFGEPLANATLHFNRTDESLDPVKLPTDENGLVSFPRPEAGVWYIHAAWAMPVDSEVYGADFATSFASLSFDLD